MESTLEEIKALFYDDFLLEAYRKVMDAEKVPELAEALANMVEVPIIK
jgi:hypothetical protein